MNEYKALKARLKESLKYLTKRYNLISFLRLAIAVCIIISLYFYSKSNELYILAIILLLPLIFFFVLKIHQKISLKVRLNKELIQINNEEISFLDKKEMPFKNGSEFIDTNHSYSYDLDIFGNKSLFHHLNRTATQMGERELASSLLSLLPNEAILEQQNAIKELAPKVEWRQEILAQGRINSDDSTSHNNLKDWAVKEFEKIPFIITAASFITPVLVALSLLLYFFTPMIIFGNIGLLIILANLVLLGTQIKIIRNENFDSSEIDKILKQYSLIIEKIENESFESNHLEKLRVKLQVDGTMASLKISQLSGLFSKLDNIQNVFAMPVLNGLFLFHIHTLRSLHKWREQCAVHLKEWLKVLGEFEAMNSLANFSHNNPSYVFPSLNDKKEIAFKEVGHPLIDSNIRINNDVEFLNQNFFILTGSNMSGKSTFLRTLGVNMILTNIGGPVCASDASVHPLPVLVSMRLSDSLSDSESYFFAEVKRLKEIMDTLKAETCFVLLDEILRGTNSDDKRTGTIEVIRKMVSNGAIGAIATHDLEVCNTVDEDPEKLANYCFEVEIVNDNLVFDYKLREGICRNKSATFLMEKMGVI